MHPLDMQIREARRAFSSVGEKLLVVRESIGEWSVWGYVDGVAQRIGELRGDPNAQKPWAALVQGVEARFAGWREACDFVSERLAPNPA